jgi:hypothetical protein
VKVSTSTGGSVTVAVWLAVNTLIRKERARFETSQIRDFVPLLVEKRARRELKHSQ